jgi:hypothetical protein
MSRIFLSISAKPQSRSPVERLPFSCFVKWAVDKSGVRLLGLMTKRVGVALRLQRDNEAV